jgi:hypothetical protein
MNITTGKKFLCIKDVAVMYNSNITEYNKGKVYTSEMDGCITNNSGYTYHQWKSVENISQCFQPLEEAKWAIRRTHENYKEINEWAHANSLDEGIYARTTGWIHSYGVLTGVFKRVHSELQDGFTEIDIEAFREITEYLKPTEKLEPTPNVFQPKWGEKIEVSDDGDDWYIRTFIGFNPDNKNRQYVVSNSLGQVSSYKYCRPLQEKTFTVQEAIEALAEKHNLSTNQIKLS